MNLQITRLLVLCLLTVVSTAGNAAVVKVSGAHILLGDLVKNCKGEFCEESVSESPAPGQKKTIVKQDIQRFLDERGANRVKIAMPSTVVVKRSHRVASEKEMKGLVENAVRRALPENVILERIGKVRKGPVPKGEFSVSATFDETRMYSRNISLQVDFSADGIVFKQLTVASRVMFEIEIPIAARDIQKDTIISSTDVVFKKRRVSRMPNGTGFSLDSIVGKKARTMIGEGRTIEPRSLVAVPVILRGDSMTVYSHSGGVRISARGYARQDGCTGERVLVEIPFLNKILHAKVLGAGVGEVVR